MTFSIVARSADGTHWGVAVASRFLAAGAVVPTARAGVGALASQAFVNLRYLPEGLALLADGASAQDVVDRLTGADEQRAQRQLGVVDAAGVAAAFTGADCISWAGSRSGDGWTAQGNCLAGEQVVVAMGEAFLAADGPLAQRLLAALAAGDAAGGDARGRQSAGLLVVTAGGGYGGGNDVLVDLRVDDHAAPVGELARLLDVRELYFGATRPEDVLPLEGDVGAEVDRLLAGIGYAEGSLEDRLLGWMGWANYEERHVPGAVDRVVLEQLRQATP